MTQFNTIGFAICGVSSPTLYNIRTALAVLALSLTTSVMLRAQLTIRVSGVPANTPQGATLYASGNFNSWNPADASRQFTNHGNGKYSITLYPSPGVVEFKVTRGSWATSEANTLGMFQPNHQVTYNGQPKTIEVVVLSWADLFGNTGGGNTGITGPSGGLHVLDDNFFIPELSRSRRIWIYLPPDYGNQPSKRYPVMYMQDGQNLFDAITSDDGSEWQVDEKMDQLFQEGDPGCIIVGIDNGGVHQLNEYSPWVNSTYGGGEGIDYVHFIINSLKPHVDANYRTLADRNHTAIMGSSMGGLISLYALIEYQNIFSKAGVFSPSIWFAGTEMQEHIQNVGKLNDCRIYLLAGGQEPNYIGQGLESVVEALSTAGFDFDEMHINTPSDGTHQSWFWSREYPLAYQWLFEFDKAQGGSVTSTDDQITELASTTLQVFPNPATTWVRLKGDDLDERLHIAIIGNDGKTVSQHNQQGTDAIYTGNLPKGNYFLRIQRPHGRSEVVQFTAK
jgi:predicted alpha/beta superfamily hydrolase